jgi:acetyltransferase-like isoleucine patch superfamily enzyme
VGGRLEKWGRYYEKWRWYERNSLPWRRLALHREFMRRDAYLRWPVNGNLLEAMRAGRMEIGRGSVLEPHCWISLLREGRLQIGEFTAINFGVFISVLHSVSIGSHTMIGNGSFISDGNHEYRDPVRPVPWQGFYTDGPVSIGDNCWIGVNSIVTSGVTIGDRCIVGANSVVTKDVPPYTLAAGVPARVIREIEYGDASAQAMAQAVGEA